MNGITGGLPDLNLKRGRILLPTALREAPFEFGNTGQRGISFAQAILRIRLPIERRVGLRAVQLRELIEFGFGAVVAILVKRFAAVLVKLTEPIKLLLLSIPLFLFPVAPLLLAISSLLFAVTLLLLLVLAVLLHISCFFVTVRIGACRTFRPGSGLRRCDQDARCSRSAPCKARHCQQNRQYNPRSV